MGRPLNDAGLTGVSYLLDLLARDASGVEFERPVVEARSAGLPAADIEELERAKRVALGVHEQLDAHRRREAELAALFQTASDLAALTSVDDVLAAIVRRARALLGRDTAYLCLNDDERGDTYMRVTDGSVSAEFQAVRLPLGAGLGGLVALQGVPIASADYFHDDRFPHTATIDSAVHAEGLVSILGVPLKRGSQVIGVLFAADRRQRAFSREEVALLSSLAAHAAVALDNARLLAETRAALISLEQANAALREQSLDIELAVLAHDRLAELVLRGGGVAEVAAELAELLGGGVDLQVPDPGVPIRSGQSSVPVVAGSEVLGRLVLTREGEPRPADLRVLQRGAVVTALLLLFNRHLAEVANRNRRDLLEDLLTGSVTDPDEIAARAADVDADLSRDLVLVVCALPRQRADPEQASAFFAGQRRGLSARIDGHIVLLLPGDDPGAAAREASAGLGRVLGGPVTAAGEHAVTSHGDIDQSGSLETTALCTAHRRAADCLSAMLALGREGTGATVSELGFIGVLLSAGDTRRRFVTDTLGPVLEYDAARGSDLAATLDAWFGVGGHLGRAAGVLHLHPNTVGQRLSRIGALLGPGWAEPDRALQLQLALQLRSLISSDG